MTLIKYIERNNHYIITIHKNEHKRQILKLKNYYACQLMVLKAIEAHGKCYDLVKDK